MKKLVALCVVAAFVLGPVGIALAADKPPMKKPVIHAVNGMVKSAAADSLVVTGKVKGKEAEWTFAVDPKTTIKKAGKSITAADLKDGDSVHVRYVEEDGKMMAKSVMVRPSKTAAAKAPAPPAEKSK